MVTKSHNSFATLSYMFYISLPKNCRFFFSHELSNFHDIISMATNTTRFENTQITFNHQYYIAILLKSKWISSICGCHWMDRIWIGFLIKCLFDIPYTHTFPTLIPSVQHITYVSNVNRIVKYEWNINFLQIDIHAFISILTQIQINFYEKRVLVFHNTFLSGFITD